MSDGNRVAEERATEIEYLYRRLGEAEALIRKLLVTEDQMQLNLYKRQGHAMTVSLRELLEARK